MRKARAIVLIFLLAVVAASFGAAASAILSIDTHDVDNVYINEVVHRVEMGEIPPSGSYDFTAVTNGGVIVASTIEGETRSLQQLLNDAYRNGDCVVDWSGGKIVFYTAESLQDAVLADRYTVLYICMALCSAAALAILVDYIYLDARIVKPFARLNEFSKDVAKGDFDNPLPMDKGNVFGAYSEAFDVMRINLKLAHDNERAAVTGRRELIAQLGHDIKTPLASLKAVAELENAKTPSKNMRIIIDKANQIDRLISEVFNAQLVELNEWNVFPTLHGVDEIAVCIDNSDYRNKVVYLNEPVAVGVVCDVARVQEITDNIIGNAYKYADGKIDVSFAEGDGWVDISFKDYGEGVAPEELAMLSDKFYRGEIAREKSGVGLGLFICKTLAQRMGGGLVCQNDGGLRVTLRLSAVKN